MWFSRRVEGGVEIVMGPLAVRVTARCARARGSSGARRILARSGFTLIELLVVIAIIATLAAVVAPAVFHHVSDAKTEAAKSQIDIFSLALDSYRLDNDTYPTTEQGLAALRTMPQAGSHPRNWRGPYLRKEVPIDPWGRPYVYTAPGKANPTSYDCYTLGRDGKVGGEGEDADITSWGGAVTQ